MLFYYSSEQGNQTVDYDLRVEVFQGVMNNGEEALDFTCSFSDSLIVFKNKSSDHRCGAEADFKLNSLVLCKDRKVAILCEGISYKACPDCGYVLGVIQGDSRFVLKGIDINALCYLN